MLGRMLRPHSTMSNQCVNFASLMQNSRFLGDFASSTAMSGIAYTIMTAALEYSCLRMLWTMPEPKTRTPMWDRRFA
eukprot:scaffold144930_cov18-Tisochrysis_lutea.AAC.1